jgi:uncharacterized membrane protein YhaH (DUF805 family)
MDFQTAVRTVLQQKYADFNGRASRSEYWWYVLAYAIAYVIVAIVGSFLPLLLALALIVPSIAVSIRRLHDVDKSGWWLLISLVPIVGFIVLLYFTVQRGTVGPNQYGEDPLPQALPAA